MGRLTKETQAITGGATTVWDYTYDLRHNRTKMTHGAVQTTYTYDNSNRLTQSSDGTDTTTYTYDANGNQTKVEVNGVTTESYIYNRLNQQTSATKGGVTTAYTYRPDGLRNSKKVGSGAVIKHVYDGWSIIAELNGSTVVNKVVRGIGAIYIDISGTKSYYLYNAHGDVTQLTNTGGAVTKVYKYDAFGVEINPDVNDANPYRYCAEYFDKETGSIYLRARYYQPKTGRFLTQDGWGFANPNDPLSLNLYTYCGNNPIMRIDPSGNDFKDVAKGIFESLDKNILDGFTGWLFSKILGYDPTYNYNCEYDYYKGRVIGDAISFAFGTGMTIIGVGKIITSIVSGAAITIGTSSAGAVLAYSVAIGGVVIGVSEVGIGATIAYNAYKNLGNNYNKMQNATRTGKWRKGSFDTAEQSLKYHFDKHGAEVGAKDMDQYLRKAEHFASDLKGAKKYSAPGFVEGSTKYVKNGKYIILGPDKGILSFGKVVN